MESRYPVYITERNEDLVLTCQTSEEPLVSSQLDSTVKTAAEEKMETSTSAKRDSNTGSNSSDAISKKMIKPDNQLTLSKEDQIAV
jgi:hypothetical protein